MEVEAATEHDGDFSSRFPVALATPCSAAVDSGSSASFVLPLSEVKHVDAVPAWYEPGGPSCSPLPFSSAQGGSRRDTHRRGWASLLEPPCAAEKGDGLELGTPGSYPDGAGSACLNSDNDRTKLALDRESTAAEPGVARATGSLELESPSFLVSLLPPTSATYSSRERDGRPLLCRDLCYLVGGLYVFGKAVNHKDSTPASSPP